MPSSNNISNNIEDAQAKLAGCKPDDCKESTELMETYAITVKSTYREMQYTTKEELLTIYKGLSTARRPLELGDPVFELDSLNRLHLHGFGVFSKQKDPWFINRVGWHIFTAKIRTKTDMKRWLDYMHKIVFNQYEQEEILLLNESRNLNLFDSI